MTFGGFTSTVAIDPGAVIDYAETFSDTKSFEAIEPDAFNVSYLMSDKVLVSRFIVRLYSFVLSFFSNLCLVSLLKETFLSIIVWLPLFEVAP